MKDQSKRIALFVYTEADEVIAKKLKEQLGVLNSRSINFSNSSSVTKIFDPKSYFGIILLSEEALASRGFLNKWREVVFSQIRCFHIRIDSDFSPKIPSELGQIYYIDLLEDTARWIIDALSEESTIRQTRIIATMKEKDGAENKIPRSKFFKTQSLRRAWVKVSNYAAQKDVYYDRYAYDHYNQHIEANLLTLEELLKTDKFKFDPLIRISIPKTKGPFSTNRYLYQTQPETAIVLQAICDEISPSIEKQFIEQSFGNRLIINRREESTEIFKDYWDQYQAYRQSIRHFSTKNITMFYHRIDIKQYYPRINTDYLTDIISHFVNDRQIRQLLKIFLTLEAITENGDVEVPSAYGLPAGIPLSHLLANLLLHDVDLEMKARTQVKTEYGYFRYVDDIVFFGQSVEDTESIREIFERLIQSKLNLPEGEDSPLNLEKSTNRPLPASDPDLLSSKLKGISGILQMSYFPNLNDRERREVADTIYQLLFEGNDEDGGLDATAELTRYTTMGIKRLQFLGYNKVKIAELALTLLNTVALPSHNVKFLVKLLLDQLISSPSQDFMELLQTENTPIHLTVLQSMENYSNTLISDLIWEWAINQISNRDNIIILREAALSLQNAPTKWLKNIGFKANIENLHYLAHSYFLELGLKIDLPETQKITLSDLQGNRINKRAALRILEKQQGWFTEDLPISVTKEDDSETITRIILLTLKNSLPSALE